MIDNNSAMSVDADYTKYWRLRAFPYDKVPDPRFYVPGSQHDAAHRWLSYVVQAGKGLLLLTGDVGCGKTLQSRRLIVGLLPARYDVAFVDNPALSLSEFLDEVLSQFGLGASGRKEGGADTKRAATIECATRDQFSVNYG